jgi:uncharacterized BrkB/YihY/UPF0761 family membrane protein
MIEEKKSISSHDRNHSESLKMNAAGIWDILTDSVKNYKSNGDVNQAAAMAFYSILSAIPLFILTIVVAGYFFSSYPNVSEDIIDAIKGFNPYFPKIFWLSWDKLKGKNICWAGLGCWDL